MTYNHEYYMARALELAAHGRRNTSPNPMVGAVIVAPDGRIIGEGYHRRCGEGHAEVNAIASVREVDRPLLRQSTMYVTLEPCSHWGKTPPCAKLIIDTGIPRVVVGAGDPFDKVAGRGIRMLRDAGVEVTEGVLADRSCSLNARFMTAHRLHRPFITLKWAQSSDGFIDCQRSAEDAPARFSTPLTSMLVHRLRSLHDAILVGSGTALADRPHLDCRLWPGRSPQPVILDRRGRITPDKVSTAIELIILREYDSLADAMSQLYDRGITSVLVEGGAAVLQSFVDDALWDVAHVEVAPVAFGSRGAARAPHIAARVATSFAVGSNTIAIYSKNPYFTVKNL